jgi:hypothetical protein
MIAIVTHTADAVSRDSWLPPAMASPPKSLIVKANITISTKRGMADMAMDGWRVVLFVLILSCYMGTKIEKTLELSLIKMKTARKNVVFLVDFCIFAIRKLVFYL